MNPRKHRRYLLILLTALLPSCQKGGFLDTKPDQTLAIPTSITDCQALLDNDVVMNGYSRYGYPNLGFTGCDDYYVTTPFYSGYTATDQHAVIWAKDIYAVDEVNDWDLPYRAILYANAAKAGLDVLHPSAMEQTDWNNAYGSALFFRAFAYFQLAQIFAPAYDSASAQTDWGLPLRKTANIDEKFTRVNVKATYDQIISDLLSAVSLLPDIPKAITRPSKAAVYGLLSRVYLSARAYSTALLYADSCLRIMPALLDYNTITPGSNPTFTRNNVEVIFGAAATLSGPNQRSFTDSTLFASYQPDDLRKTLFFSNGRVFSGRYDENGFAFCGLAADEIYLNRAESYARLGNTADAMADLNSLLVKRWASGTFTPFTATDAADALNQTLTERRKELLYRGLRWTDLRRLNKDPATAITLSRTVNGQVHTLPPNDPRYVYAIPANVVSFNPGMPQNPR
ncbi:MAG TPA: RagB/SusD family nutrient uptake outer membrane protein [Puia sp.]|nr:RagB/SusD family nutrient uptake outer membrane protein [Puia sp.]